MMTKRDEIHALTTAEIGRQIAVHSARRAQIVEQRATLYAAALKNGGAGGAPVLDADEKAALEHARVLLNGAAPASLSSLPEAGIALDKVLYREQRGIDIALKILNDKGLVARSVEAVSWMETHSAEWRALVREITLTAIRLSGLERSAQQLLAGCPDLFAVRLPMTVITNSRSVAEIPLDDLKAAALAEGIVTNNEIRKSENVK